MTKRKEEQKELLKHDEFLSWMEHTAQYIHDNPQKVLRISAVIVICLLAGYFAVYYTTTAKEKKASALYHAQKFTFLAHDDPSFEPKFESEEKKNEKALVELDSFLKGASGIERDQALLTKAALFVEQERYEEAVTVYQELSSRSGVIGVLALIALGDMELGTGQTERAIDYFSRGLQNRERAHFEDVLRLRLAKAQEEAGDRDKAILELETVVQKYQAIEEQSRSPLYGEAKETLDRLQAEMGTVDTGLGSDVSGTTVQGE